VIELGRELERVTRVAPFGFQLFDPVARDAVAMGLRVVARPPIGRPRDLVAGPSRVFALRGLSIGSPFVAGAGDGAFWASPPSLPAAWTVEVDDPLGRFLSFRFDVEGASRVGRTAREVCRLPQAAPAHPVLGLGLPGSPPGDEPPDAGLPVLPLFSAPSRPRDASLAMLTAQLETLDGRPAAGAVVRVAPPGLPPAHGVASAAGTAVVLFPYPEPEDARLSPPAATRRALAAQSWDGLRVSVFFDAVPADPARPDLCALLDQLGGPAVPIHAGDGSVVPFLEVTLEYGKPLVVRTAGRSALLLDAGSPPSP
jgi:hypothetical protein